jgi:hypothetical protein
MLGWITMGAILFAVVELAAAYERRRLRLAGGPTRSGS